MLRLTFKIKKDVTKDELLAEVCNKNKINIKDIEDWHIIKKSIDARNKADVHYVYILDFKLKNELKYSKTKNVQIINETTSQNAFKFEHKALSKRPVIIGAGPAGLFAAITFVENGFFPIIVEQGKSVDERQKDINSFIKTGILNTNSNIQFGEGGAGTFSDGKLTTGINSAYCKTVLETFVKFGAPEEILYTSKPHIGTDNLIHILKNIREYILAHGGTFLFNTKFIDFEKINNQISKVYIQEVSDSSKKISEIETNTVILAIGHSSRDTFYKLYENGIHIEPKNFSVGVRIEHLQEMINAAQYGSITKLKLPPADYKLAYHNKETGRSCYTFCMCPGGTVMASSSEKNTIVTNGMSKFLRDGVNANSAVLVNVTPSDFASSNVLAGIDFQKDLEEKAFVLGGSNYFAPIQRFEDFLNNSPSDHIGVVKPSYLPGVTLSDLNTILPAFVSSTLKEGISFFGSKLAGFDNPDSILTGVETRSSSPVRIVRNSDFSSNVTGLFPCGEGAGYAGGVFGAGLKKHHIFFSTYIKIINVIWKNNFRM